MYIILKTCNFKIFDTILINAKKMTRIGTLSLEIPVVRTIEGMKLPKTSRYKFLKLPQLNRLLIRLLLEKNLRYSIKLWKYRPLLKSLYDGICHEFWIASEKCGNQLGLIYIGWYLFKILIWCSNKSDGGFWENYFWGQNTCMFRWETLSNLNISSNQCILLLYDQILCFIR